MSTIKEIAHLAGVSRGTVDRVLNNRGSVNPDTEKKIRDIANALHYTPNRAGKILAAQKKPLKIGFIVFNSSSNPFFVDVVEGAYAQLESLKEYGVMMNVQYSNINKPETQIELINQLLQEEIDGLIITPVNHPLVKARIKELTSTGFPVVTTNSDIPDCGRIAYVGSNYWKSGETAAGLTKLLCNKGGKIGIISGSPLILCHTERVAGFSSYFSNNGSSFEIIDTILNYDDDLESFVQTKKMLNSHPQINMIYLTAAGVQGACRAIKEANLEHPITVVSHDTTPSICEFVENSIISATIGQQAHLQGSKPLDILFEYLAMDIKPQTEYFYTDIEIKIKENLYL